LAAAAGGVEASLAADAAAEFHSIDSDTFAKLFRPKSILCQKTLEVVIEQIRCVPPSRIDVPHDTTCPHHC
jgi:hypothetical protein